MHLGSTVTGIIRDDKDAVDAVDAILPAGTLSGAPKFRACQIIEELEQSKRGIYGGAIGYLDLQEIWIPVLPSAWFTRKTEKSVSVQVPERGRQCTGKGISGMLQQGKSSGTGN